MSIGIAMIARNGAKVIPRALTPFRQAGGIDQTAIVLGGISSDDTEAVARQFADRVEPFKGELDEKGRLTNFSAARQQAFDLLDTDWAVVVDCDDIWHGVERLGEAITYAEKDKVHAIMVPYHIRIGEHATGSYLWQGRIFRRNAGKWVGTIHEHFKLRKNKAIRCEFVGLTQDQPEENGADRKEQNIQLELAALGKPGNDDLRTLAHLIKDLINSARFEEAEKYAFEYLTRAKEAEPERLTKDEGFGVLYHCAGTQFHLNKFDESLLTCLMALNVKPYGQAWALLGELLYRLAQGNQALNELAIFASKRALFSGRSEAGIALSDITMTSGAAHILGDAHIGLGEWDKARGAYDLALKFAPGDKDILGKRQFAKHKLMNIELEKAAEAEKSKKEKDDVPKT